MKIYHIITYAIIFVFCHSEYLFSQESGNKKDFGKVVIQVAVSGENSDIVRVYLECGKDTILSDYKTGGTFFWNKQPVGIVRAIVQADGYITDADTLHIQAGKTTKKYFYLTDRIIRLQAVTVKGNIPAMVYRGDTIRFNPKGINILEDDVARNILEQMPGVEVSEQSVKIAGKEVEKTYIDGKKVFGENPMNALNHLPANDVVYISAYDEDEHKEQARKNRRGKQRRVLNIETKSKLVNSKEGNLIASMGGNMEKQRLADHDIRYGIGGTFNFFSEKMLVAVNTMHNNLNRATNQPQMFLSTKNPPQNYSKNTFGGLDFSRRWEKETGFYKEIKGGYKFAQTSIESNTRTLQEYFVTNAFQQKSYLNQYRNTNRHNKHIMNAGFDMNDKQWGTLDINYTLFTDNARQHSLQQIRNSVDGIESSGNLQQNDKGKSREMQGTVNWSKFFGDWQYSLKASYSNYSQSEEEIRDNEILNNITGNLQELISIPKDGEGNKWEARSQLKRMLSKENNTSIGVEYHFIADNRHINQLAWNKITGETDPANTYSYQNHLIEHTPQIKVNLPSLGFLNIELTAGWQHFILKDKKKLSLIKYEKKIDAFVGGVYLGGKGGLSNKMTHTLAYTVSTVLPNITQLRLEIQNSNPYFISSGNPNLKAGTKHNIRWSEQYALNDYGHWINSELLLNFIQNSISNKNIYFKDATYLPNLKYTTIANSTFNSYDNINGYWSADWKVDWMYPINKIKSNLGILFVYNHEQIPYYYNQDRNIARINNTSLVTSFRTSWIQKLRISANWSIKYQLADNKMSNQKNEVLTNRLSLNVSSASILKYFFGNVSYAYNIQNNKTYHQVDKENILNIYAGAKIFKRRAELSLTAFDLLDSFRNRTTQMKDNYTSYIERENFGRYFTINFAWKFRQIKSNRVDISRGTSW